jgi:ligand-binding sensor domain-containing protein/signal transduction histidine kinase
LDAEPAGVTARMALMRLAIAALVALAAPSAAAEQLPVRAYGPADGLPSTFVHHVSQDTRGFLWFSSRDGLARFDGVRFMVYGREQGLPVPTINSLLQTRGGDYWVATNGGGVCRMAPEAALGAPSTKAARAPCHVYTMGSRLANRVNVLFEDRTGRLWAGTDAGLFTLDASGGRFRSVDVSPRHPLPEIRAMADDGEGSLWIGSASGLFRRLPGGRVVHYPIRPDRGDRVSDLAWDGQARLWAAHRDGFLVFHPEPASAMPAVAVSPLLRRAREEAGWLERDVALPAVPGEARWFALSAAANVAMSRGVFVASDGDVWLGGHHGLYRFDGARFRHYTTRDGLTDNLVRVEAEDRDGNLWLASQGGGVMKLTRGGFTSYDERDGLGHPVVHALFAPAGGGLHVVSGEWVLSQLDGRRFTSVSPLPPGRERVWGSQAALLDRGGGWWLLAQEAVGRFPLAARMEDVGGRRPPLLYSTADGLTLKGAHHAFEDRRGDVWFGSRVAGSAGLFRWERTTGRFHRYGEPDGVPADRSPVAFCEDGTGGIWMGFYQGGLARFRDGRFTLVTAGAPTGMITSLHRDDAGRVWVGSNEEGVARIDDPAAERPRLVRYTTAEGLSSDNVRCLTSDRFGRVYLGSARGVDRLDPRTGHVQHYSTSDGLASTFITAALRDTEGALWFGTIKGVSRLVPRPPEEPAPPPVWIAGLRIGGLVQPVAHVGAAELGPFELAPDQNQLQIDFLALGFGLGESLRYQYRLEGADRDWGPAVAERTVHYPRLTPGRYRFLVRAVGSSGQASRSPAQVAFTILPPLWARPWFLAAAAMAVALLAYGAYRLRLGRLLALERVRTRIATDLHDDIGASLSQIAIWSELARRRLSREDGAAEPLIRIAESSRELVDSMSDIVWAINPRRDRLGDLLHRMRRFASDTFTARDIAFRFQGPETEGGRPLGADVRRQVLLIFKEAVNNLARHSGSPRAEVDVAVEDGRLTVRLSDEGRGFDAAAGSDGHGLASMRERARALGAALDITSTPGRGTTILLGVPLARPHRSSPPAWVGTETDGGGNVTP